MTSRDEEEPVDCEPEEPAKFSAAEDSLFYSDGELPVHGDEPASNIVLPISFPVISTEAFNMSGRRCSKNVFKRRWLAAPNYTHYYLPLIMMQ
jgi:hypothetical protein